MNITEANAAQIQLGYLLDPHDEDCDAAYDAMRTLADRSSAILGAGLRGADVDRLWPGGNYADQVLAEAKRAAAIAAGEPS